MNNRADKQDNKRSANGFIRYIVNKKFSTAVSVACSILIMGVLVALVYFFRIPNPSLILIAGIVLCSMMFGFGGGIVAALPMLGYTMYYFSENNDFFTYTAENTARVWVTIFGTTVVMIMVSMLKHEEVKAFDELSELSEQMNVENEKVQRATVVDTLTGVGNRLALRVDIENYLNRDICILLVDIDDFKHVNDLYGNDVGDLILVRTAKLLSEEFGAESCYRYGGDEFLVIVADPDREECIAKIRSLIDDRPEINMQGDRVTADYSIGYHFAKVGDPFELREMLINADRMMYESKRAGKNRIFGDEDKPE